MLGGIAAMYGSNDGIAGLTCACFTFALIPIAILHRIEFKLKKDKQETEKEAQIILNDAISNYKTLQSFGQEEYLIGIYEAKFKEANKNAMKILFQWTFSFFMLIFMIHFCPGVSFLIGGW